MRTAVVPTTNIRQGSAVRIAQSPKGCGATDTPLCAPHSPSAARELLPGFHNPAEHRVRLWLCNLHRSLCCGLIQRGPHQPSSHSGIHADKEDFPRAWSALRWFSVGWSLLGLRICTCGEPSSAAPVSNPTPHHAGDEWLNWDADERKRIPCCHWRGQQAQHWDFCAQCVACGDPADIHPGFGRLRGDRFRARCPVSAHSGEAAAVCTHNL